MKNVLNEKLFLRKNWRKESAFRFPFYALLGIVNGRQSLKRRPKNKKTKLSLFFGEYEKKVEQLLLYNICPNKNTLYLKKKK